jgi:hypothetical protein
MAKEVHAEKKHFEIKSLNVLSIGKVFALLGAFTGFIFGIIVSFLMYKLSSNPVVQQMQGFAAVTWKQLIGLPFWYLLILGVFFGLASMIFALIYNQIAKTGGLKFNIK